jgi:hypothetical protein
MMYAWPRSDAAILISLRARDDCEHSLDAKISYSYANVVLSLTGFNFAFLTWILFLSE